MEGRFTLRYHRDGSWRLYSRRGEVFSTDDYSDAQAEMTRLLTGGGTGRKEAIVRIDDAEGNQGVALWEMNGRSYRVWTDEDQSARTGDGVPAGSALVLSPRVKADAEESRLRAAAARSGNRAATEGLERVRQQRGVLAAGHNG